LTLSIAFLDSFHKDIGRRQAAELPEKTVGLRFHLMLIAIFEDDQSPLLLLHY
jgi:hypothetical protein